MPDDVEPEHQDIESGIPAVDSDWVDDYEPDAKDLKELQSLVRSIYETDEPLFTKDRIRAAIPLRDRCCRNSTRIQEFYMDGYHGKPVKVIVYPELPRSESQQLMMIWSGPFIHYSSIESMLCEDFAFDERIALPVDIRTGSMWYQPSEDDESEVIQWTSSNTLTDHFIKVQDEWLATEHYAAFKQVLQSAKLPTSINKIIGYALGSYYVLGRVREKRSLLQHAMILLLRDILSGSDSRGEVECFLQDPSYSPEEKNTNGALGMKVVEDPEGFLIVDDQSVIVSIAPNVPVKQIVLDLCRPAAIIWMADDPPSDETEKKRIPTTDPESTRVQAIIRQHYDAFKLPDSEAATDLRLYVRKP